MNRVFTRVEEKGEIYTYSGGILLKYIEGGLGICLVENPLICCGKIDYCG